MDKSTLTCKKCGAEFVGGPLFDAITQEQVTVLFCVKCFPITVLVAL